jgi:hypothetical protein
VYVLVDMRIEASRLELRGSLPKIVLPPPRYPGFLRRTLNSSHPVLMPKAHRTIAIKESSERIDCPLAPPKQASTYTRALHVACLILGGIEPLAKHLQVSTIPLRAWITGEVEPPFPIFLAAVEVVLLHLGNTDRSM